MRHRVIWPRMFVFLVVVTHTRHYSPVQKSIIRYVSQSPIGSDHCITPEGEAVSRIYVKSMLWKCRFLCTYNDWRSLLSCIRCSCSIILHHVPGAGSIARFVNQQSNALSLCYGFSLAVKNE